ncbi:MAG: lipid-A-disaccharide synthase [Saprospiraceae bacterium]|nr:lipid-A-disaccharide synthase [Saprospiraceae bacterium]
MRLYLIAGEASGDLHGSNLLKALYAQQPDLACRAWGGDLMQNTGATLVKHYRELAFMGFVEVAKNLRTILRNIDFCKRNILDFQPDALVLIDYPGFNLRIARWAKQQGIPVVYYISPQLWAWHASRAHAIRRDVDKLLVILPFEKEFFKKYGIEAEFVGHPLLDEIWISGYRDIGDSVHSPTLPISKYPNIQISQYPNIPTIALLPGSRKQEVSRILPRMLEVTEEFPDYQFVIAGATSLSAEYYAPFLAKHPRVRLLRGQTYEVLRQSKAALVKSGTSTLETALLDVPQVVCYAGNWLSYRIAKRLVKVKYISLVNLIMDRPMVRELIQDELNQENLKAALSEILSPEKAAVMRAGYAELRERLGGGGASERAATAILKAASLKFQVKSFK